MLCHALLQQGAAAGAVARLWCPPSLFTIHMQFEFGLAQTPAACRVTSSTARHAWTMLAASCWAFGTTPTAAGTAAGWLHHRWAAGGRWVAPAAAQVSLCCCHGSFEVWLSCSCSRAGPLYVLRHAGNATQSPSLPGNPQPLVCRCRAAGTAPSLLTLPSTGTACTPPLAACTATSAWETTCAAAGARCGGRGAWCCCRRWSMRMQPTRRPPSVSFSSCAGPLWHLIWLWPRGVTHAWQPSLHHLPGPWERSQLSLTCHQCRARVPVCRPAAWRGSAPRYRF